MKDSIRSGMERQKIDALKSEKNEQRLYKSRRARIYVDNEEDVDIDFCYAEGP
jgi:hypothetical protein